MNKVNNKILKFVEWVLIKFWNFIFIYKLIIIGKLVFLIVYVFLEIIEVFNNNIIVI